MVSRAMVSDPQHRGPSVIGAIWRRRRGHAACARLLGAEQLAGRPDRGRREQRAEAQLEGGALLVEVEFLELDLARELVELLHLLVLGAQG